MSESSDRLWSRFLEDAITNSPEFRKALDKEQNLLHEFASKGELGENVTVMCCGDGREVSLLLDLQKEFPQLEELNGVDILSISIDQVREATREQMQHLSDVNLRLLQEDATCTSIEPNSQDTVMCLLTMVNFNDEFINRFCCHVESILKPGGKFIVSVYNNSAFNSRIELYKKMGAPIEHVDVASGFVKFEDGFDEAPFSRQFTEDQFYQLVERSGLELDYYDNNGITHMGVLEKPRLQTSRKNIPSSYQMTIAASVLLVLGGAFYANYQKIEQENAMYPNSRLVEVAPGILTRVDWKKN